MTVYKLLLYINPHKEKAKSLSETVCVLNHTHCGVPHNQKFMLEWSWSLYTISRLLKSGYIGNVALERSCFLQFISGNVTKTALNNMATWDNRFMETFCTSYGFFTWDIISRIQFRDTNITCTQAFYWKEKADEINPPYERKITLCQHQPFNSLRSVH